MEYVTRPALVIDNGSTNFKIGFEGDQFPLSNIPNLTGVIFCKGPYGIVGRTSLVGYEVMHADADYLWYPVRDGGVNSWDSLEHVYNHFLYKIFGVDTTRHAFLIVDSPFNTFQSKMKMASLMFEKYNVPALNICDQAVLSLKFAGRRNGLVVDCGGSGCNVIPVYNGRSFLRSAQRIHVGGDTVTRLLMSYMKSRDYEFKTLRDIVVANKIKSVFCYVSDHFWKSFARHVNGGSVARSVRCYRGTDLKLGEESYVSAEVLFSPSWASVSCPGIHESILTAITTSPIMMQPSLIDNIVLCGGTSLLRGFPDRVTQELRAFPELSDSNVISLPRREVAGWIGGSRMATQMKQDHEFITKEQFEEAGPNIIRNLCI